VTAPKISTIRAKITGLQAELAVVEAAGRPVNDTLPRVAELLEHMAQPYTAGINLVARQIIAARGEEVALRSALNLHFDEAGFAVGAIAKLLGERILDDIDAEIALIADAMPAPLSDSEQGQKIRDLRASIRALERDEEALIEGEEAAGNHVDRRRDADVVAVLNIPDGICAEFNL
jgi:hypothetical protein